MPDGTQLAALCISSSGRVKRTLAQRINIGVKVAALGERKAGHAGNFRIFPGECSSDLRAQRAT
jgi:hypothetical protein